MFESLRFLSDSQIISGSKTARAQEHAGTLSGLGYLVEIERRRIHLTLGCSSLFDYCLHVLGYSESQAQRRIIVARCVVRFPDVFPLLEKNEVNLGTVARVSKILTPDNHATILARIRRKSLREVEAIAAEFDPESAMPRDRIRTVVVRVPVTTVGEIHLRNDGKKSSGLDEANASAARADDPGPAAPEPMLRLERRARVEFTAHEDLMTKLDRIRSLAAHRLPANATMEQLVNYMAEYMLRREDPVERQKRRESGRQPVATHSNDPRQIPAGVRDQVFARDNGRCTYAGSNGKRCNSTHMLQLDHRIPVARGGKSTVENLRLLCAYHNRLEAERIMGRPCPPNAANQRADELLQ
jgi:5-methylcytosine-specific restriction endonuclease McrA